MERGVPIASPLRVASRGDSAPSSTNIFASPKSVIFGTPPAAKRIFAGFKSRWNDPLPVGVFDGAGQRFDEFGGGPRSIRRLLEAPGECPLFREFEREEGQPGMLADFEDLDDVRVLEAGDGFRFGAESDDLPRRRHPARFEHFQDDVAPSRRCRAL